jgi:hypothetical protein
MTKVLALSFAFATLAVSVALGADAINTATLTCKELETSSHNDMVAMDKAMYAALKNDPKFSSLSLDQFANAEDSACTKHPDAKVIDALKADN